MEMFLKHFEFAYVGMYLVLGGAYAILWLRLAYIMVNWLLNLLPFTKASLFDPSKKYDMYARVKLGTERYYIVGINTDSASPDTLTYAFSPTMNKSKGYIVVTIKKPLT